VARLKQRTPATYSRGGGEYDMESYKRIVLPHILAGIDETAWVVWAQTISAAALSRCRWCYD